MRRKSAYAAAAEPPISELNTTPLIDVMLVLLVMFIMIIPIVSHKVTIDQPRGNPPDAPPAVHRLNLDASNQLSFDGRPISFAALPVTLAAVRENLNAELHLSADGAARYEVYDELLAEVKRAGIKQLGLVGNERFQSDIVR